MNKKSQSDGGSVAPCRFHNDGRKKPCVTKKTVIQQPPAVSHSEPCARNDLQIKEIFDRFDGRQPLKKNAKVYNALTFLPEVAEFFVRNPNKTKPPFDLCPVCGEIGIVTSTPQYLYNGELCTTYFFIHHFLTKQQVVEIREKLERFFAAVPYLKDLKKYLNQLTNPLDSVHCERMLTQVCLSHTVEPPTPRDAFNQNAFKWTQCPKCGGLGELVVKNGRYFYVWHFDQTGNLQFKCYLPRGRSIKNPLKTCPVCGENGRKTVERGHTYFKHYKNGSRVVHYAGAVEK